MPRASHDYSQPYAREVELIAFLKKNIPDVLPDLKRIYQYQLKRFSDIMHSKDIDSIKERIQHLKTLNITQVTKSRAYIVTNLDYVPFVLVDMDDVVINNLIEKFEFPNIQSPEVLTPDFISTLFVFKGKKLFYWTDLRPRDVINLTAAFKNENLYNFSRLRNDLYAKPRKQS